MFSIIFSVFASGKHPQLERHILALTLVSLWFTLLAGPTLVHQFYLPGSENNFDMAVYKPILTGAHTSERFDGWMMPSAVCLAVGSMLFSIGISIHLDATDNDTQTVSEVDKKLSLFSSRVLQIGAIAACLFALRTLHRAPIILGASMLIAGLCHVFVRLRRNRNNGNGASHLKKD